MKKIILLILVVTLMGLAISGCSSKGTDSKKEEITKEVSVEEKSEKSEENSPSEEIVKEDDKTKSDEKYLIGVSLYYRSDEFYIDIENMMKKKAEEIDVDLIIQDADGDSANQLKQFEDFIQMGVDAIVFSPTDPVACIAAVESANEAKIPVFTYDGVMEDTSGITSGMYNDFLSDGQDIGTWAKDYIMKNLDGKAKVAILDFPISPVVCGLRADGFEKIVKELPDVEIVARQDGQASRTGGMEVMENILTAENNEVDMVFAINYESAAGAASAIESAGADTVVTCVAWGKEALEKLDAGDPYMKAYLMGIPTDQATILDVAKQYLDGQKVEAETYYKYIVVDQDNLNEKINWREIIELRD